MAGKLNRCTSLTAPAPFQNTVNIPTKDTVSDLAEWLSKQPRWLQYATADLLAGKSIGKDEITTFATLALSEVSGKLTEPAKPPPIASLGTNVGGHFHYYVVL